MIVTLTGPTCSGKSSVEAELQRLGFGRAVSHTTRYPRAGEIDGRHYHFITDDQFRMLDAAGEFIETIEFGSARYAMSATSLRIAQQDNEHVAIVADPRGASQIHDFCEAIGLDSSAIWIDCDPKEQARRWVARLMADMIVGKEVVGAYAERLGIMLSEEMEWRNCADYYGGMDNTGRGYDLTLDSTTLTPTELAVEIKDLATKGD